MTRVTGRESYDAIFFVNHAPNPNMGGAETYNRAIIEACLRLKLRVLVVVSGAVFHSLVFKGPDLPGAEVLFLHAVPIGGGRYIPAHPKAMLRVLKRHVWKLLQSTLKPGATLHINSFASEASVAAARKALSGNSARTVFIDTIFRRALLQAVPQADRRILIGHDVFHERIASFRVNGYSVLPDVTPEQEAGIVREFTSVLAISDRDAASYRALVPEMDVRTVYQPVASVAGGTRRPGGGRILYLGSAAYANIDGLGWFLNTIWPQVRAQVPEAELDVVGAAGDSFPSMAGVRVHGRVDDIAPIARAASFAINPVRMGSGLKIKMLDYFAHGLGCITTSFGAQGFPSDAAPFVAADEPDAYARETVRWLREPGVADEMAARTAAFVDYFSESAAAATIGELLAVGPDRTAR